MKILKIEIDKENQQYSRIHFEHNGMRAYYYLMDTFFPNFSKELDDFKKMFFDIGEENWAGVMEQKDILEYFGNSIFIHSITYDLLNAKLQQEAETELYIEMEKDAEGYKNENL